MFETMSNIRIQILSLHSASLNQSFYLYLFLYSAFSALSPFHYVSLPFSTILFFSFTCFLLFLHSLFFMILNSPPLATQNVRMKNCCKNYWKNNPYIWGLYFLPLLSFATESQIENSFVEKVVWKVFHTVCIIVTHKNLHASKSCCQRFLGTDLLLRRAHHTSVASLFQLTCNVCC